MNWLWLYSVDYLRTTCFHKSHALFCILLCLCSWKIQSVEVTFKSRVLFIVRLGAVGDNFEYVLRTFLFADKMLVKWGDIYIANLKTICEDKMRLN